VWCGGATLIAVTRKDWELAEDFADHVLVLETPTLVVGADASLYHRRELITALQAVGVSAGGTSPSHLIAAAYRAWGESLVDHLAGDYAFVIWDRRRQRLVAARDPLGSRPLFYARIDSGVAVASSSRALADLLGTTSNLNLASLGTQVSGLAWSIGTDCSFVGVEPIAPGHRLEHANGATRLERFWETPAAPASHASDATIAAEELRRLICSAVNERLSATGPTTVWMSGGWDSTAVFGAGEHVLPAASRARLQPVSISYPVGDPGREDEFIGQVADHWKAHVHWLKSDDIPLLDGLAERAAGADEPPAHLYELWNRELARATRAVGSRVALDGGGGDQLFQVSDVVIADRLRNGKLLEFARLTRSRRSRGLRHLARAGVLPLVAERLVETAERLTGRTLPHHYLERPIAEWIRPEFAARHALRERDLVMLRHQRVKHLAHAESRMYLSLPVWSHGASFMHGSLLQEGVEVRSPLLDLKVIEFALSRPISERASAGGTKTLLRKSMHGLLPPSVLAPRRYRTGMTIGFSRRRMREAYPALVSALFAEPLRLADLGMVDPVKLRAAAERCCAGGGDEGLRVNLFHAMKVEFWLRGLDKGGAVSGGRLKPEVAVASAPAA
jgi:asparagine synthase (glutamine-hydrolysing)